MTTSLISRLEAATGEEEDDLDNWEEWDEDDECDHIESTTEDILTGRCFCWRCNSVWYPKARGIGSGE